MSKIRITKFQLRGLIREILEESFYEKSVINEWDSSVAQSAQDAQIWTNVPYSWRNYKKPPPTPQPDCLTCGDEEDEGEKNKKLLDEDELDAGEEEPGTGADKDGLGSKSEADLEEADIDEETCIGSNCWSIGGPFPYRKGLDTPEGPFKTPPSTNIEK